MKSQSQGPINTGRSFAEKLAELNRDAAPVSKQAISDARRHGSTTTRKVPTSQAGNVDTNIPLPKANDGMFYGLVGDVARAAADGTEVNPVASGAAFLTFLGAMVGRDIYLPISNTRHHARLFMLHIGRSARAGKGDSLQIVRRLAAQISKIEPGLLGQIHVGGLSTREGLAVMIHDGYQTAREVVEPIKDKRLLVIEPEFAQVLQVMSRQGNTLSSGLRQLWDGDCIQPATKTGRIWASDPHVGVLGHMTPYELHATLGAKEMHNGFLNRFLMFWAERTRDVPFPTETPRHVLAELTGRTLAVVRFAKGAYPDSTDSRRVELSHDARELWESVYRDLRNPSESEQLASILERTAPYAQRLAMLFALSDRSYVIEKWHLSAALEWVRYWQASVRFIFADQAREARQMAFEEMAVKIREYLEEKPEGASQDQITTECFARKATPLPLGDVLSRMQSDPRYGVEMEWQDRADGKPGRKKKVYRLS